MTRDLFHFLHSELEFFTISIYLYSAVNVGSAFTSIKTG